MRTISMRALDPQTLSWVRRAGPTWLIIIVIYTGWGILTWQFHALPWWLVLPAGGILLAWHGSLQHEAVHGQLAPWRCLNDLPALPPLSLWLPFPIYRATHVAHHDFDVLTEPWRDPESFYVDQSTWRRLPRATQGLLTVYNTLLGRLLIGPFLVIGQFFWSEAAAVARGDRRHLAIWLWHLPATALVLAWVIGVCAIPLWQYALLFMLPGASITLIRSYPEHKAAWTPFERTAVVEAGAFFSLLFFNNNLHFAHHKRPDLPWHALPRYYRRQRAQLLEENGGLLYRGYREVFGRFLVRPIDTPAHPYF